MELRTSGCPSIWSKESHTYSYALWHYPASIFELYKIWSWSITRISVQDLCLFGDVSNVPRVQASEYDLLKYVTVLAGNGHANEQSLMLSLNNHVAHWQEMANRISSFPSMKYRQVLGGMVLELDIISGADSYLGLKRNTRNFVVINLQRQGGVGRMELILSADNTVNSDS